MSLLPTTANWQPALGTIASVVEDHFDIDQALRIILTTPKGSDPHRPEFGADILQYIDWPEVEAVPPLIAEIADAILLWEPRVQLVKISPKFELAHVTLTIEWRFRGIDAQTQTTEVNI